MYETFKDIEDEKDFILENLEDMCFNNKVTPSDVETAYNAVLDVLDFTTSDMIKSEVFEGIARTA